MRKYDHEELLEREQIYNENPFKGGIADPILVGNLEKVGALDNSGRLVLKYVVHNLNQHSAITKLEVESICKNEFPSYPKKLETKQDMKIANTLQIRVRRGIKNLLYNEVIAKTATKYEYYVNKSIVWR